MYEVALEQISRVNHFRALDPKDAEWQWHCPRCGKKVVASYDEKATPELIAKDGRCYSCRRKTSRFI